MESRKLIHFGYYSSGMNFKYADKNVITLLSNKTNIYGRILLTLTDYLIRYLKKFDGATVRVNFELNRLLPNGTMTGMIGLVNQSKIDIGFPGLPMDEITSQTVDFFYPFELVSATFVTRKAEYNPQVFGIFQTFSWPLWLAIVSVFTATVFLCYATFKCKYSFSKISLHVLGILLRQSLTLKPSFVAENLLLYSWVVGAMFLSLAYESVFLSFLAIPPVTPIRDISRLAKAVQKGEYHCVADLKSIVIEMMVTSKRADLKVIGRDILRTWNNSVVGDLFNDFFRDRVEQNLAFLVDTETADLLSVGKKFVSEDQFGDVMAAMMIRKHFCCKKLLEKFVHKLMASGLYFKYRSDKSFLLKLQLLLTYSENDDGGKRKLTLIDVAPAFIILCAGYILSVVVLIGEIILHRKKSVRCLKERKSGNSTRGSSFN